MTFRTKRSLLAAPIARLRVLAAAVVVAGALLGCGDDDETVGPATAPGTYTLVSVVSPAGADNAAPFVLFDETVDGVATRYEATSGSITLTSSHRYSSAAVVNYYEDDALVESNPNVGGFTAASGAYSVSGSVVTFTSDDPSVEPVTATLSGGNTLTFSRTDASIGSVSAVFRK